MPDKFKSVTSTMSDDDDDEEEIRSEAVNSNASEQIGKGDSNISLEYLNSKTIPEDLPESVKHVIYSNELKFTPEETQCSQCHGSLKEEVQSRKAKIVMMSKVVKGILYYNVSVHGLFRVTCRL